MAQNLSPELLAKLKAHVAQNGQTAFEDGGFLYQPDYTSYSSQSAESGGGGSTGNGDVSGWIRVKKGDAKSSRMIDQFTVDGAANGQRKGSYTNVAGDIAKFGLAAAGVHGLGTLATGAMNAGLAGAGELGTTGLNSMRAGELAGYATNGTMPGAAVSGLETAGATGLNAMRAGELAGYATDGSLPGAAVTAGTGGTPSGLTSAATTAAGGIKDGWDILSNVATSPVGKLIGGAVVSGLAADALTPDVDMTRFNQLFDNMLAEQQKTSARGDDLWASYQSTWKPMQEAYAKQAMDYNQPWRREQAATEASNTVASQYDTMRTSAERDMIAAGLDPATIATLGASSRMQEAKDQAGAQNNARADVENRGMQYLGQAAQFGQQVPGMALNASGLATNQGTSALNAATTGQNQQNQQTNNRNAMFGDILGAGLQAAGMGLFDKVKTATGLGG